MSNIRSTEWFLETAQGNVPGASIVNKFGRNAAVGTSVVPLCLGGGYRTPTPTNATTLRVKAGGDANDTADGSGAREITLQGLDETGALVTEAVATAGASASAATTTTFMRLFRAFVSASGTYATQSAGSHSGAITIENSGGTQDWAVIAATDFPAGQTQIGAYSVPLGYTAYVSDFKINVEGTKTASLFFFKRGSILDETAPMPAMRLVSQYVGLDSDYTHSFTGPPKFEELTDIGFMAKVGSGTSDVTVEFDIYLVKN